MFTFVVSLNSYSASSEPTFVIFNETVGEDNVIAELASGSSVIKVTGVRITPHDNIGADYLISCLNPNGPSFTQSIYVNDELTGGASGSQEHSYILIENQGSTGIERVEFVGISSSPSEKSNLICFISREDEGYFGVEGGGRYVYSTSNTNMISYIPQTLSFDSNQQNACSNGYDIPENVYKWDRATNSVSETIEDIGAKIKYIRLNWSASSFAGSQTADRGKPLNLLGLRIFMEEDSPVSIEENDKNQLIIENVSENNYSLNEFADVEIYNIQGSKVFSKQKTDSFDITMLSSGVYIIKVTAQDKTITKKIIHN